MKGQEWFLWLWGETMVKLRVSRREFLKRVGFGGGALLASSYVGKWYSQIEKAYGLSHHSEILAVKKGTPEQNLEKILEMLGGISNLFGSNDVAVIKPNAQWWNQGCPNLAALKKLVELILERPGGFSGEVIVAENCHRGSNPESHPNSAWNHVFDRNSDIPGVTNLGDVCALLKQRFGDRFTTYHWIDADNSTGNRIYGPDEGAGYVYCDGTGGVPLIRYENGATGGDFRETIMTYPIFTSDRGTVVDLKNGIWEGGTYTDQPLKFINLAALNHHGGYTGITSAIKNYLGVSDLSGGPDPFDGGKLTDNYYNFHSFPFNEWKAGPVPGMLGGEVGTYLTTIRKAFLNITTAEWVGLTSRTELPADHARMILASTDPVALDYFAGKYVMLPRSGDWRHDPQNPESAFHQYLQKCSELGAGTIDENKMVVYDYDFSRVSIDRKIKEFKVGSASEQEVKDGIEEYMETL